MKLAEMRDQAVDALGMDPGMDLELDDESTVTIPNPMFVSEDAQALIEAAEGTIATAKAILGPEEHARLIAGGGHSSDVMLAWRLMAEDAQQDPKLPR
ncbi:MAG TPA: hypothetical protein VFW65_32105 [Pseudonocardiaceae bacterium]|nr:hypothetical protein [Pseudonocardiaceae bacterium]